MKKIAFAAWIWFIAFSVSTSASPQIQFDIRAPLSKNPSRYPAVMIFGGFQNAGRVLDLVHPKEPTVLASFDYPFSPPRKFEFPQSLAYAPEVKTMVHRTILSIGDLAEKLRQRSDVDPNRIVLIGASLGAPLVAAAAAQDRMLQGIVLVHGFGQVPQTATHQLMRAWEPKYGLWPYPLAWLIGHLGWIYLELPSPEESIRNFSVNQKVLMITAEDDQFIPRRSSDSLWKAIRSSPAAATRITLPGDHLQPGSDALIEEIMRRITGWMKTAL